VIVDLLRGVLRVRRGFLEAVGFLSDNFLDFFAEDAIIYKEQRPF